MLDELFNMLNEDDRLSDISDIAFYLDEILRKTNEYHLKKGFSQNESIDAIINILIRYKKTDKDVKVPNFQSRCY